MNTILMNTATLDDDKVIIKRNAGSGGGSADIPQDLMDIINSLYLSEMNEDFNNDFAI